MKRWTDVGGWTRPAVARVTLLGGLLCASCADPDTPEVGRASAEIEIGPEVDVGPSAPILAAGSQGTSGPLRAGDHYLVAWLDSRRGWPESPNIARDLMAARVTDDGTVLDPVGFPLIAGPAAILHIASGACSDDGLCLVVGGPGPGFAGPISAVRVQGDQVLDPTPLVIADGASLSSRGVAWDGQQFRVVYSQAGVTASSTVTEAGAIGAPVAVGVDGFDFTIGCGGTRCLVVASSPDSNSTSMGRLLDPTGPVGPPFLISDPVGRPSSPSIHWDGIRYWLGYVDLGGQFGARVYLVRVSANGLVLDPAGITIATAASNTFVDGGSIGRSDDGLIVTWERNVLFPVFERSVRVTRVQLDGTVLDPDGVVIGTFSSFAGMRAPTLACGPDACLGTGNEPVGDEASVRGYRLDGTTLLDPAGIDVSTAPPGQAEPAATYHAGRYVAVWRDARPAANSNQIHSIHGVLFPPTMDSYVPFGTSVLLGSIRSSGCPDQRDPKVAATSTSVMVTWHEECLPRHVDESYAQAFGLDGQPLTPALDVGNRNGRDAHPSVVSDGSEFVVLWDYEEPTPPRSIQMRRYDAGGAPLTDRVRWNRNGTSAIAAFDGTNYLVVWQRPLSTNESRPDLFAARMAPDGTALDADIPIATLPTIPEDAHSVACGGGVCLVAWRHAAIQVRAVRLGLDGTVLDATPMIFPTDGPVPTTSIAFDGEAFLLTWETEAHEIHAAQITPAGEIIEPGDFLIAAADPTARHPVVVSTGAGHMIEMHERYDASPTTRMRRLRARVIGEPAPIPDAGVPDASPPDASPPDASPPDAGPPDASLPDGGVGEIDYVVSALSNPPAAAVNGAIFSVGVTVRNNGGAAAEATSTTRFFLSVDTVVGGDRALARNAVVPPLAGGSSDSQTLDLVVPGELASGSYFLLACADRGAAVPEVDERNNCRASASAMAVTGPDLVVEAVGDPPPSIEIGKPFSPSDTTRNLGTAAAATSNVAYYLSPVPVRGPTARRLSTTRPTGPIGVGQASSGAVTAQVPAVAAGAYFVLACADFSSTVAELEEQNNCAASAGTTSIGPPDLVVTAVGDPPAVARAGESFSVTSTTLNQGFVPVGVTTTRFFLSEDDQVGDDVEVDGLRLVPALGVGVDSAGTSEIDLAPAAPPGDYFVLACADATGLVAEAVESNNCLASTGRVTVLAPDPACGDGELEPPEQCDDGNAANDDGCDADCVPTAVTQVAAGALHTCVLLRSGGVKCWGVAELGTLGYGNTDVIGDDETPASVGTIDLGGRAVQLVAGGLHNCARLTNGRVRCWGYNIYGQLGYGNTATIGDNEIPASAGDVDVGGAAVDISAGSDHTCALLETGAVRCWGRAAYGALGYGDRRPIGDNELPTRVGPVDVGGVVVEISAGSTHTCARLSTGAVRCWGQGETGVLGYGNPDTIGDDEVPAVAGDVDLGGEAVQIRAGRQHTCSLMAGGAVRCWGTGFSGELGYANEVTIGDDEVPAIAGDVDTGGTVTQVDAGYFRTCALLQSGSVLCWGSGAVFGLGYGDTADVGDDETPASVGPIDLAGTAAEISTFGAHTCALLDGGALRCWGNNTYGELGLALSSRFTIGDDELPTAVDPIDVF